VRAGAAAHAVVTPVSSNTVLERSGAFAETDRTRIGSPFVIAAMNAHLAKGEQPVVGYEANGGFLLGSPLGSLEPLPTRDAVLPVLAVIVASRPGKIRDLIEELPPRVTYSDRIQNFATEKSEAIFAKLLEGDKDAQIARLNEHFGAIAGAVTHVDLTDGIRMTTEQGAIIHLRRSGNAPELRCYSESDTVEQAKASTNRRWPSCETRWQSRRRLALLNAAAPQAEMVFTQVER
jgi:phosphomannomutase